MIKKKKAFTLLEILVGTMIFAVVMVITTSVISQSVSYQEKIKAMRLTSEQSEKVTDMLSRDIKSADGNFVLQFHDGSLPYKTYSYKSGLAVFNCSSTQCNERITLVSKDNVLNGSSTPFNTVVIANKDKIKIYFAPSDGTKKTVHYLEYDREKLNESTGLITVDNPSPPPSTLAYRLDQIISQVYSDGRLGLVAGDLDSWTNANSDLMRARLRMWGLVQGDDTSDAAVTAITEQPYIGFRLESEYGPASDRRQYSISTIDTTVTSRNYTY